MKEAEELENRLRRYRNLLRKSPAHFQALEDSLAELDKNCGSAPGSGKTASAWRPEEKTDKNYDRIFLHVYAPVLVSYVEWVLEEALRSGKKRIYFLARDGWLMYQTAAWLSQGERARKQDAAGKDAIRYKNALEVRYLKVSRFSLRMAEYCLLGEKCLDVICVGGIDISFRKIMKRAALTEEESGRIAQMAGYGTQQRQDAALNHAQIQKLKEKLRHNPAFLNHVYRHSGERYENTIGYLRQEGLLDGVPIAVADSGWIGTMQKSLAHLMEAGGKDAAIEGYYFGVYGIPEDCSPRRYHGCYIRPQRDILRKTKFCICLFETVFSSPEGMTLEYGKDSDRGGYFPVESTGKNPNAGRMWRNRALMESYLRFYLKHAGGAGNGWNGGTKWMEKILSQSMGRPTKAEARILGEMQFCDDVLELQLQDVAARWSRRECRKQSIPYRVLVKANVLKATLHESGWPEASLVNAGAAWRIRGEHLYKFFLNLRKTLKYETSFHRQKQ